MSDVQQIKLPEQYLQGDSLRMWAKTLPTESDLSDKDSPYKERKNDDVSNCAQYIQAALTEYQCYLHPLVLALNNQTSFWMQVVSVLHRTNPVQAQADVKNCTEYISSILHNYSSTIIPVRNDSAEEGFEPTIITLW